MPVELALHRLGIPMIIGSFVLFMAAWFGFSVEHGLVPNVTWKNLGLELFAWRPLYSYTLTFFGIILLGAGFGIILKSKRGRNG